MTDRQGSNRFDYSKKVRLKYCNGICSRYRNFAQDKIVFQNKQKVGVKTCIKDRIVGRVFKKKTYIDILL